MKTRIIGTALLVVFVGLTFTGCVTSTNVRFNTDEAGALVFVDGEKIGTTPAQVKMSNAIWEDPDVTIKKEGFKDLHVGVRKEVKPVNLVCGLLLWWPSLLWVYGPKENQVFELIPEK